MGYGKTKGKLTISYRRERDERGTVYYLVLFLLLDGGRWTLLTRDGDADFGEIYNNVEVETEIINYKIDFYSQ